MKILVVTENDDCCGPMAARFLNDFSEKVEAFSAGVSPAVEVRQNVVELMRECFCDLSDYRPVQFQSSMLDGADCVIVIGQFDFDASPCRTIRLELPQNLSEASSTGEMRALRDHVKNESFVILKSLQKH